MLTKLCTFSSYIIRAIYIQKVLLDQNGFLSVPILSYLLLFVHQSMFSQSNRRGLQRRRRIQLPPDQSR